MSRTVQIFAGKIFILILNHGISVSGAIPFHKMHLPYRILQNSFPNPLMQGYSVSRKFSDSKAVHFSFPKYEIISLAETYPYISLATAEFKSLTQITP